MALELVRVTLGHALTMHFLARDSDFRPRRGKMCEQFLT